MPSSPSASQPTAPTPDDATAPTSDPARAPTLHHSDRTATPSTSGLVLLAPPGVIPDPLKAWDHYELVRPLGQGGMGTVFLAKDRKLGRLVALKFLRVPSAEAAERLLQEARAQARLDHNHICKVFEVGEFQSQPYIAMEYIDGQPLHQVISRLSTEQKVLLIQQIALAVQSAHSQGILHRDLKPAKRGSVAAWRCDFRASSEPGTEAFPPRLRAAKDAQPAWSPMARSAAAERWTLPPPGSFALSAAERLPRAKRPSKSALAALPAGLCRVQAAGSRPARHLVAQDSAGSRPARHFVAQDSAGSHPARHFVAQDSAGSHPARHFVAQDSAGSRPATHSLAQNFAGSRPARHQTARHGIRSQAAGHLDAQLGAVGRAASCHVRHRAPPAIAAAR